MKWRCADFILIAVILVFAVGLWVYPLLSPKGDVAKITGKESSVTLPLSRDTTYEFENCVIQVKNGEISVSRADCPDQVCVNTGAISRNGQSIICVPNQIVITIGGNREVDAVAD